MKQYFTIILSLLLSLGILFRPAYSGEIKLPDMGASSSVSLTPQMEEQIGREIATQIRNSHFIIDDLELNEYLQNLGYSLVANSDDAYQNFHFFLINSGQINAFATPGGVVAVYSGLFLTTETESELASVLGHEIAHVTQRHLARSFEKSSQLSLPIMAAMIAGILLGAAGGASADVGAAAVVGMSAAGQQAQINYTRANEKEADRIGMRYLALSGYNPEGMPGFFQKLERKNRYAGKNYPEFLRTHPITLNRIAEATQRAAQYKHQITHTKNPQNYHLMKAKLRVLTTSNADQLVQYYRSKISPDTLKTHPQYHYGYGLALFKNQNYSKAIKVLHWLYDMEPQNTSYVVALGKAYIASGQKEHINTGLAILAKAHNNKPYNLVLTANYAFALIAEQQLEKSIQLLEKYHQDNIKHPAIYKLLSRAYGKQQQLIKAHLAEAEYYYLNGQLKQAIMQLTIARKLVKNNDFYTLSRIEARQQAIEDEQALYKLENN